jgi:Protein of unknown function (DUF3631)
MGKARKPLTANRLARMLKPLGIAPQPTGPEDKRVSGYVRERFQDAFERYLGPEGVSQPHILTEADEMGTSEISQPHSQGDACEVANMQETQQRRGYERMRGCEGGSEGKAHVGGAKSKSDDLPYSGPVVKVPDMGPDALDEHGEPVTAVALGFAEDRCRELAASCRRWKAEGEDPADLEDALRNTVREEVDADVDVEAIVQHILAIETDA